MNPSLPVALASAALLAACAGPETDTGLERYTGQEGISELAGTDWMAQAAEAELRGQWEQAAFFLDRWLLGHAPDASWYERRAVAAERSGDFETGARMRQQLLDLDPDDLMARIDLADDLQQAGRGLEGVMLLEAIATDPETSILALRALGELHERDGRSSRAAEAYERLAADERVPDRSVLLQNASRLREEAGDAAGALRDMEQALEGTPLEAQEQRILSRLKSFESGQPQSVADAVALMTLHSDPEARLRGARYLTNGPFPDDVAAFGQALGDEDPRVVRIAAREVALRGDGGAAPLLVPLLAHPEEEIRLLAIRGLGRVGTLAQVPDLLPRLDPEDRAQFRAVRTTLEAITGHEVGVELDPDLERRTEIAAEWGAWWSARKQGGGRQP